MVEPPRNLPRDLHVRRLVDSYGHKVRLVHQNVGRLQHRIAENPNRRQVLLFQLLLLVLVSRNPLQPAQRRNHLQQRVQRKMRRHLALQKDRALLPVQSGRQKVQRNLAHVGLQRFCIGVVGGQRVVVGDEVEALILRAAILQHLVLQLHPVLQRAHVVAQVQPSRRTHAAQNALARRMICLFAHFSLSGKGTGFCPGLHRRQHSVEHAQQRVIERPEDESAAK